MAGEYPFERARDAFIEQYELLAAIAADLSDDDLLLPSRCRGWSVVDVFAHLHIGCEDFLITVATPTENAVDTDFASYWTAEAPGTPSPDHALFIRRRAAAYTRPQRVAQHMAPAIGACLRQARALHAGQRVLFQGHVLTAGDFLATWALEGAVHHLDITLHLDVAKPSAAAMKVARDTFDALAGEPLPAAWSDETALLKGSGREMLTAADADVLGDTAQRFPLLG